MWKTTFTSISGYEPKKEPGGIEGMRRVEERVDYPTWDQVRAFIERLDGKHCTEMSLEGLNQYVMVVGGGPDRFNVSTIGNDMGPYDLLGPELSDETAKIILGGVATDLPRRFISTREQALQAAEYFFHQGQIDPKLNWHLC
jgi:hypothetical protein